MSGIASFGLAAFAMTLPATPPAQAAAGANAPFAAIKLLAVPAFLVLFVVTFMDALVHQAYFQFTSPFLERAGLAANWIMPAMSIGQIAEIATMAVLGAVIKCTRLAHDDGGRHRGARGAILHLRDRRSAVADGRRQRRARDVLRVLLRRGLHLRGRALPARFAGERARTLQSAHSRARAVRRQPAVGRARRSAADVRRAGRLQPAVHVAGVARGGRRWCCW